MQIENFSKIIFLGHESNDLYLPTLGGPRHDCQSNMDAELPVFRILHPKPCARNKYPIWGVFCAHTGLGVKSGIMVVWPLYFAGRLVFSHIIWRHTTHWCVITLKLMSSRFSALWINAKIWH